MALHTELEIHKVAEELFGMAPSMVATVASCESYAPQEIQRVGSAISSRPRTRRYTRTAIACSKPEGTFYDPPICRPAFHGLERLQGAEAMTEQSTKEFYSVDQASQHAAEWCKRNPAWRRICDIPDISVFEKTYDEIPKLERAYWDKNGGEECWREFGAGGTKVPTGFISGKGEFFDHVLKVPLHHNMMMVYRVGKRWKP